MLSKLLNPQEFHNPISIDGQDMKILKKILNLMLTIRKTEQQLALAKKNGLIGGPVHLGVGQEAIAVGISQNLKKTDRVFGNHRSHSHLLALNPNFYKLFAEVLGKETGFSKGMGGSMHLIDQSNGFYGSTPIVAGTVPLAVGAAMASKMQNLKDIGVSYIGDGAVEEGVVHECFNLAKVLKAPILFVIENNFFASHMHISLRQPSETVSRFAEANHIPYKLLDGNDVVAVAQNSKEVIDNIRNGKGPEILELITYRWYGHVDWREDLDVGVARSMESIKNWKARDPIHRLSQSMINSKIWTKEDEKELGEKIDNQIQIAWEKAMDDPYPSKDSISEFVYSKD
ncbi:thiamine pyrophosphate-dependent dehydrogenase E1 component subunit alpha [Candidatus Pelagibacter sp.]|nr:thiamine pyrophosphate-dependent dehydrogenase E1 component subunit alpha [Candidatus Pelagibacter sp.]